MKMNPIAVAASLVLAGLAAPRAADGPYRFVKDVAIGGEGGWDYLNVDAAGKRLLISHGTKVVVFDLKTDTGVGETADTPGAHAAGIPSDGHICTTSGSGHTATKVT